MVALEYATRRLWTMRVVGANVVNVDRWRHVDVFVHG